MLRGGKGKNPWMELTAHVRAALKKKGITAPTEVTKVAKKFYDKAGKDLDKAIKLFDAEYK